jgi:hypothetical protein
MLEASTRFTGTEYHILQQIVKSTTIREAAASNAVEEKKEKEQNHERQ